MRTTDVYLDPAEFRCSATYPACKLHSTCARARAEIPQGTVLRDVSSVSSTMHGFCNTYIGLEEAKRMLRNRKPAAREVKEWK